MSKESPSSSESSRSKVRLTAAPGSNTEAPNPPILKVSPSSQWYSAVVNPVSVKITIVVINAGSLPLSPWTLSTVTSLPVNSMVNVRPPTIIASTASLLWIAVVPSSPLYWINTRLISSATPSPTSLSGAGKSSSSKALIRMVEPEVLVMSTEAPLTVLWPSNVWSWFAVSL